MAFNDLIGTMVLETFDALSSAAFACFVEVMGFVDILTGTY